MEDFELFRLAEQYYNEWLKLPNEDTPEGMSIVNAIKYALKKDRINRKDLQDEDPDD
jgi:hypothetical protein